MQITNLTYSISNKNYTKATTFNGRACTKAIKTAQACDLGSLRDGYIGRLVVEKANGRKDYLDIEKYTQGKGKYETYCLKNDKKQLVGFIDITIHKFVDPILPKGKHYTDYVYVSNINNYSRPGDINYDSRLERYQGIGTKLMQIALKRSEEAGCNGKIELHASTDEIKEFFYKQIGFAEDLSDKYREFSESKMFLPAKNKEMLRQKNGGFEIILGDGRVLLSK